MAYPTGKNPFFTDEDDSVGFGSKVPALGGHREVSDDEFSRPVPTNAQQLQQFKEESMNRQLDSTQRALASIYDSERMGVATAEVSTHFGPPYDHDDSTPVGFTASFKWPKGPFPLSGSGIGTIAAKFGPNGL